MTDLKQLNKAIVDGDAKKAVEVTKAALAEGAKPLDLIQNNLIPAMDVVGKLFEEEEYFVPELLLSGRAMRGAFDLIRPLMVAQGVQPTGRVIIGTVQGDLHDIGKNLVGAMLEGAGFEVTDLGADVKPEAFVEAVKAKNANIVACSAMLTVTMPKMKTTIEALKAAGLRDRVKVMIGGAPISQAYCNEIGADAYSETASGAAALARDIMVGTTVTAQYQEKGEKALAGVAAASQGEQMTKSTTFRTLAVSSPKDLLFGFSPKPVNCGFDLTIGNGTVFPEVNFTLPIMDVTAATWPEVIAHYEEMATNILKRAVAQKVPGIVLEFEQLPQMTETPEWGAEITALLERHLKQVYEKYGLRGAARITPADIRGPAGIKGVKPVMRHGQLWEKLNKSFDLCIAAGGDLISIESIGAKEVHDEGLMFGDVRAIVYSLGALACRDMTWLWNQISEKCEKSGHSVAAGDTACGFANTSMVLAYQKMLPDVLAAVDRAMCGVRTLKAVEAGAKGPSKDCGYENPIVKAISGIPISQEGKAAACAHFSDVGNISASMCDLWSNESVQNIRLLSGNAPEAFTELLAYDTKLMNIANSHKQGHIFQSWMVESDQNTTAIGTILTPESVYAIAKAIVAEDTDYHRTIAAGKAALTCIQASVDKKNLKLGKKELQWLDRLHKEFANLPKDENVLGEEIEASMGHLYDPECYGLPVLAGVK